MLVTENGISTRDDEQRITYTRGALEGLTRYIADASTCRVPVKVPELYVGNIAMFIGLYSVILT